MVLAAPPGAALERKFPHLEWENIPVQELKRTHLELDAGLTQTQLELAALGGTCPA
jgi:hypothetical protein